MNIQDLMKSIMSEDPTTTKIAEDSENDEKEDKSSKKEDDKKKIKNEDEQEKEAAIDKLAEDLYAAGGVVGRGIVDFIVKQASAAAMNYSGPGHNTDGSYWLKRAKDLQRFFGEGKDPNPGNSDPGTEEHQAGKPGGKGPEVWAGFPSRKKQK